MIMLGRLRGHLLIKAFILGSGRHNLSESELGCRTLVFQRCGFWLFSFPAVFPHGPLVLSTTASGMLRKLGLGECSMEKLDRITIDAARMNGEPCIRNLRLTVRRVLQALAAYPDRAELKREYPELEDEDIRQVLAFAAALVDDKVLPFPQAR